MNASTSVGPRRPTAGIDWAKDDHAVAIVDPDGVVLQRVTVVHTSLGLRSLIKTLRKADVEAVGIERFLARAWLHVIWRCWQDRFPLRPRQPPSTPTRPGGYH